MLRILKFPRDILLHLLLHNFTVQELIQLRCLSPELYDLVHYCLGRRRSLKLFFSFSHVQAYSKILYEHNLESDSALRLHPPGPINDELILDADLFLNPLVDLLVDHLFPNVTHLIIVFDNDIFAKKSPNNVRFASVMCHIEPYLISRMCTRLTGLSLFGMNRRDSIGDTISRQLLRSINKIQNLRRLDFCVMWLVLCSNFSLEMYLNQGPFDIYYIVQKQPFLALEPKLLNNLEHLSVLFQQGHFDKQFCEHSFRHLGPNLTHLAMHQLYGGHLCFYTPETLLLLWLNGRTGPQATSSITHLKLTQHLSILLPKILPQFTQIKLMDLVNFTFSKDEQPMSILELFGILAKFCPKLTELKLSKFKLDWILETENLTNVPQLHNITSMVFNVHQIHYYDREMVPDERGIPFGKVLSTFAYLLPNLEQLYIKTAQGHFRFRDNYSIMADETNRLRMLSIGCFNGANFTCHQLLSAQYLKRYIRESGERWAKLSKHWELFFKNSEEVWINKKIILFKAY